MTPRHSLPAYIRILGILSCLNIAAVNGIPKCEELEKHFSGVTQSFIGCALRNSEPVTYCQHCGNQFAVVISKYNLLFANEECRAKYFDQDHINIVEMVYSNTKSIWNAGSCSNCYDWVDGALNQTMSNATNNFFLELNACNDCIHQYNNESACSNCIDSYSNVNDIYKNMHKTFNEKLCFDIKDAMNKTRLNWSHNLKCCKDRKTSLTAFLVISGIISALVPFVFYTSFMFFGWRRDQIQEPLIDSSDGHLSEGRAQTFEAIGPGAVPAITHLLDL